LWLTVAEAATEPWVVDNLLKAGYSDTVRSRAMTGKPARQIRTDWTEAWDGPDNPDPLPMPLQGIVYADASARFMRARSSALSGSPAGQIIGSINKVKRSREVVLDMVEEYLATVRRLTETS
jgi:NAD(P)H-dependent flavin oxidoreductase YrpB (nitropropane dioxygenase family)